MNVQTEHHRGEASARLVRAEELGNGVAQCLDTIVGAHERDLRHRVTQYASRDRVALGMVGIQEAFRRRLVDDLGEGHPLLGRRMPDLDVDTPGGTVRVFTLLHDAHPVLLNLGQPWGFDISPWAHRVLAIDADYDGDWELPALGQVAAPAAVLIRPDGYVAWVGDGTETGLRDALTTWFGSS